MHKFNSHKYYNVSQFHCTEICNTNTIHATMHLASDGDFNNQKSLKNSRNYDCVYNSNSSKSCSSQKLRINYILYVIRFEFFFTVSTYYINFNLLMRLAYLNQYISYIMEHDK